MTISISKRVMAIEESKSIGLAQLVANKKAAGLKIIALNVGEPDFPTPDAVIKATQQALIDGHTRYDLVAGIVKLREKIANRFNEKQGTSIGIENVLIANGSKQILYNIFQTIINPDDEVIIPTPYWVSFPESIKLAGGIPVICKSSPNHQLDIAAIKKAYTTKTKAIIFNAPNNPAGVIYSKKSLVELADFAVEKKIYIIADEAYEALVFDKAELINPSSFSKEALEKTITVQSFSKSHSMTGFRVGYMVANKELIKNITKLQGHLSGNNCTFAQYGALAALEMPKAFEKDMASIMQQRRDLAYKLCLEIFDCVKPVGAFYVFPNCEKYFNDKITNDIELAEYILEEALVAVLPGSAFGASGFLRISFSSCEKEITEGFKRIKSLLCK